MAVNKPYLFLAIGLLVAIVGLVQAEWNRYSTGNTPETEAIQSLDLNPSGIIQRVETSAGWVTVRWNIDGPQHFGSKGVLLEDDNIQSLWWQGGKLAGDDHIRILAAYPEKGKKPSILIINKTCGGSACGDHPYLVDMGIDPPFTSKEPLSIAPYHYSLEHPYVFSVMVGKRDENVYLLMGRSTKNQKEYDRRMYVVYVYDRKNRKIYLEK